jgi:dCMP deaminase
MQTACISPSDPDLSNSMAGIGYNGFPRGCSDDQLPWAKASKDGDLLKTKYP